MAARWGIRAPGKGPEPGFQNSGLGVRGIEGKWEMRKGCGRWKERVCS